MKFGDYLLRQGKIKRSELKDALRLQTESFVILGEQAIAANVLNKKQVGAIMGHQRVQGGFFGDIAVNLGFLNKDDVDKCLGIRNREDFLFGKKLVSYGAITKEDIEEDWRRFKQSRPHDRRIIRERTKGQLNRRVLD